MIWYVGALWHQAMAPEPSGDQIGHNTTIPCEPGRLGRLGVRRPSPGNQGFASGLYPARVV